MVERPIIAIAGATGNAGREMVKEAARRGSSVRALVRDESRLGDARSSCAEVRVVQVTDPESIRGALAAGLFSRNLGQLGEFFVESAAWGLSHDALAPAHGSRHLADYLRARREHEKRAAS